MYIHQAPHVRVYSSRLSPPGPGLYDVLTPKGFERVNVTSAGVYWIKDALSSWTSVLVAMMPDRDPSDAWYRPVVCATSTVGSNVWLNQAAAECARDQDRPWGEPPFVLHSPLSCYCDSECRLMDDIENYRLHWLTQRLCHRSALHARETIFGYRNCIPAALAIMHHDFESDTLPTTLAMLHLFYNVLGHLDMRSSSGDSLLEYGRWYHLGTIPPLLVSFLLGLDPWLVLNTRASDKKEDVGDCLLRVRPLLQHMVSELDVYLPKVLRNMVVAYLLSTEKTWFHRYVTPL